MTATKLRRPTAPPARRARLWLIVGGAAVAAFVLAIVLSAGDSGDGDAVPAAGAEVTLTGDPLPRFDAAAPNAAAGLAAPEVTGVDFAGEPVAIEADGTPKAIIFLTHW